MSFKNLILRTSFIFLASFFVLNTVAQEIEEVWPECIIESTKGVKTVDSDPIQWAMIKAIQELSAKNDALAAEVEQLKSQLNN